MFDKKIRVGIRGISGLLGNRLALAIQKQKDIEITVGIGKNDNSLQRIISGHWTRNQLPEKLFLDEPHKIVRQVNRSQSKVEFVPVDQANLKNLCDIIVDATPPGCRGDKWDRIYRNFGKPVILQSGEYPDGVLIAPPIVPETTNLYRQGDCILSGIAPLIDPFREILKGVRVNILMQYGQYLNDYPTSQRVNSTYLNIELANQIEDELGVLLPGKHVVMEQLLQVPALNYYTITLHLETEKPISEKKAAHVLELRPRIMRCEFTSTYEIDHFVREEANAFGMEVPPIVVYDFHNSERKIKDIKVTAAIYSRLIAILPNIDTIRIISQNMHPLESMALTDKYAGFGERFNKNKSE
ncbi:MAG: Glyceraldehyde-3-phosphate dehydrogenase [Candidatus Woesearchaeota archaeon]|nr:Glyceraldehyde-3-phosphate dehydrogenase [Candidatus Woesearchaeota archaeon]